MINRFHFAFKVKDIENTIRFYHHILGCKLGRQTEQWVDFEFFGHQLSAHVSDDIPELDYCGHVDDLKVPIPHFGCILTEKEFDDLKLRLLNNNIQFIIKPQTRYKDKKGEQQTMFILDYSKNPLEFKSFKNEDEIF